MHEELELELRETKALLEERTRELNEVRTDVRQILQSINAECKKVSDEVTGASKNDEDLEGLQEAITMKELLQEIAFGVKNLQQEDPKSTGLKSSVLTKRSEILSDEDWTEFSLKEHDAGKVSLPSLRDSADINAIEDIRSRMGNAMLAHTVCLFISNYSGSTLTEVKTWNAVHGSSVNYGALYSTLPPAISGSQKEVIVFGSTASHQYLCVGSVSYRIGHTNLCLFLYYEIGVDVRVCAAIRPVEIAISTFHNTASQSRPGLILDRGDIYLQLQLTGEKTESVMRSSGYNIKLSVVANAKAEIDVEILKTSMQDTPDLLQNVLLTPLESKMLTGGNYSVAVVIENELTVPLEDFLIFGRDWNFPESIVPFSRQVLLLPSAEVQLFIAYHIAGTDLRIAIFVNNSNRFEVSFIPVSVSMDQTLMNSVSALVQSNQNSSMVVRVCEFRNIRVKSAMTVAPKSLLTVSISTF